MAIQKNNIIGIVTVIIVLMLLFPPWVKVIKTEHFSSVTPDGYSFLLDPPVSNSRYIGYAIDWERLIVQIAMLGFGAVGYMATKRQMDG